MSDEEFDRFIQQNGLSCSENGGILVNQFPVYNQNTRQYDYKAQFKRLPTEDGITLYSHSFFDLIVYHSDGTATVQPTAEINLLESSDKIDLRPEILLSDADMIQSLFSHSYGFVFPERTKHILEKADYLSFEYSYFIQSTDTKAVYKRLKETLNQKNGYTFSSPYRFGEGINADYFKIIKRYNDDSVVLVNDYGSQRHDYQAFFTLTNHLYRFFITTVFLMIALNIINVVHMNRLSRRREYAILTSLGLGARQRLGMTLYESFRLTVGSALCGAASLVIITKAIYPHLYKSYYSDGLSPSNVDFITTAVDTLLDELLVVAKDLWQAISSQWYLVVIALLFLFFGFVLTDHLIEKRFEKDELVAILKDDMHE